MSTSKPSRWTVIGGGPCGIGSVGRLLDHGIEVTWIDPKFEEGRMGEFYANVPSNTLNGDLIAALRLSPSLCWEDVEVLRRSRGERVMSDLEINVCYDLGLFVDTIAEVRKLLMTKTTALVGEVCEIVYDVGTRSWNVCMVCAGPICWHSTDVVLYCGGSRPTVLSELDWSDEQRRQPSVQKSGIIFHNLDYMVDPVYCTQLLTQSMEAETATTKIVDEQACGHLHNVPNTNTDDNQQSIEKWAVVGNSHSGMLVMMNLYESGVRNIINFLRSDLRFMHDTAEGWRRYQGVGLKGPVGAWARSTYIDNPHIHPVRLSKDVLIMQQLQEHRVTHCVVAIGYERNMSNIKVRVGDYALTDRDFDAYDHLTGEIPLPPQHMLSATLSSAHPPTFCSCNDGEISVSSVCSICTKQHAMQIPRACLFGGGIAFPQDLIDGGGNREPWVGFKRSIEQVDLMVDVFRTENEVKC